MGNPRATHLLYETLTNATLTSDIPYPSHPEFTGEQVEHGVADDALLCHWREEVLHPLQQREGKLLQCRVLLLPLSLRGGHRGQTHSRERYTTSPHSLLMHIPLQNFCELVQKQCEKNYKTLTFGTCSCFTTSKSFMSQIFKISGACCVL